MRNSQPTFAGGEVSDAVAARWDVAKYGTALARARNTLGLPQGGQYNRPGLVYGDSVKDHTKKAVLLPFGGNRANASHLVRKRHAKNQTAEEFDLP